MIIHGEWHIPKVGEETRLPGHPWKLGGGWIRRVEIGQSRRGDNIYRVDVEWIDGTWSYNIDSRPLEWGKRRKLQRDKL